MAPYRIATLDVFTSQRFTGNQLGLVHVPKDSPLSQEVKQAIAKEFNYSETVFLHEDTGAKEGRRLDIFTPYDELPFAGHPTIGALCYIAQEERKAELSSSTPLEILLSLKAGTVKATYNTSTRAAAAQVPHDVHIHSQPLPAEEFLAGQRDLRQADSGNELRKSFEAVSIVKGMTFIMGELPTLEYLGEVTVPMEAPRLTLDAPWNKGLAGCMFYTEVGKEGNLTKCRTRMVESKIGEDAATGSASCALGAYLALTKGEAGGQCRYDFEQGVEMGRRSMIRVEVKLDTSGKGIESVVLAGEAVVVMKGEMDV